MRLAVLSDHADQKLCSLLQKALVAWQADALVFHSDFDNPSLEILDPGSALFAFNPDVVYINLSTQAVRDRFYNTPLAEREFVAQVVVEELSGWVTLILQRAQVVVNLLPMPRERHSGSFSGCLRDSLRNQIRAINHAVVHQLAAQPGVLLNDLEHLAAEVGHSHWYDERFWCHSKYACRPSVLPAYAASLVNILRATRGKGLIKCIVTDLDNTLWQGVIGDDGLSGIEAGGMGVGEAHQRLQHYFKTLKNRGIIICVCSKNEDAAARLPFQRHSGMILKEDDFACFTANWQPKSENIRAMAAELNLSLDSFVFVDDSPFERAEVRAALPQVIVPELPEDPAAYCAILDALPGLEMVTRPSAEDARRTQMYLLERERTRLESQTGSREEFLQSLHMKAVFAPVDEAEQSRAAQLIQRSNQFNLRTQRFSGEQVRTFAAGTGSFACFCTLEDKFGDHGIIAILCGEVREPATLFITEWVMSCRVLGRGVEEFIRNQLVELARSRHCTRLLGEYLPTEKNAMVSSLYERLGFQQITGDTAQFELHVDAAQPLPTLVQFKA